MFFILFNFTELDNNIPSKFIHSNNSSMNGGALLIGVAI
jgi:hypothetical protein